MPVSGLVRRVALGSGSGVVIRDPSRSRGTLRPYDRRDEPPIRDTSPEAFPAVIEELLAGPEPELETIDAAEALREVRVDR